SYSSHKTINKMHSVFGAQGFPTGLDELDLVVKRISAPRLLSANLHFRDCFYLGFDCLQLLG
ncbi:MAG: hypothetical protein ACK55Z_04090, partial [bacterium]